jgi:hypothetical protein
MDTQATILKSKTYNPRVIGNGDTVEFSYDFTRVEGLEKPAENIREFTTLGGAKKKQAEVDKYRLTVSWFEPNDNVPTRLYNIRAGGGDRTVQVTYIHSDQIIGRVDYDPASGGKIVGYIADFSARRRGIHAGMSLWLCTLTIQEA